MNPTDPLSELRGLSMPDPVLFDWWPLSIGWWILLILLFVVVYLSIRFIKKLTADNWYKQATLELHAIRLLSGANEHEVPIRCSALCRRVAMAVDGRDAIAGLTGADWLEKLDQLSGSHEFTTGLGVVLGDHLWQKPTTTSNEALPQLLDSVSRLIKNNKPRFRSSGRVR